MGIETDTIEFKLQDVGGKKQLQIRIPWLRLIEGEVSSEAQDDNIDFILRNDELLDLHNVTAEVCPRNDECVCVSYREENP